MKQEKENVGVEITETSFDLYTRYFLIARLADQVRTKTPMRILDVGGTGGLLRSFLKEDEIVVMDTLSSSPDSILGDITHAPFESQSFDLVISSDVYEHIPSEKRAGAISEMLRLSENFVILGAPFYSPEVAEAEATANNFWLKATGEPHRWLREHIENKLPHENELESLLKKSGYEFYKLRTNNLPTWLMHTLFSFYAQRYQIPQDKIAEVWRFYNENFADLGDFEEPTYRKIYLIGKRGTLPQVNLYKDSKVNRLKQHRLTSLVFDTILEATAERVAHIAGLETSLQEKVSHIHNLESQIHSLESQIQRLESQIHSLESQIHQIQQSIPMQLVNRYQRIVERILRSGTRRRHYYELVLSGIRVILNEGWRSSWYKFRQWLGRRKSQRKSGAQPSGPYEKWIAQNEPNTHELRQQKKKAASFRYRPKLSIITPVWNPEAKWLKAAIESVLNQTYDNWELCLVGSSSTDQRVRSTLNECSQKDSRVKVKFLPVEESISTNLKGVLSLTGGEYVGILDQEHELAPFALYQMVKLLNKEPETDFIYSDEDKISRDSGHRFAPLFKPAWAPDTLRSSNYIGRFFIVQRKVADLIAGNIQITSFDDSDAYDLVLQVTEKAKKIFHIPKILCHERETFAAPCAFDIETEVEYRNKVLHSARLTNAHGGDNRFKFSLIILNKNKPEYIIPLLEQLRKGNTGDYYEVIIGDTGTEDEKVLEYYGKFSSKIKIIRKLEYHFGGNYNFLIANYARGEVVGIMNNDIILPKTLFLNEIEDIFVNNKDVSVVGAKLLYPDGRLQHGGIFFMENSGVNTGLPYHRLHGGDPNRLPTVKFERVPAVTGSFMFCKRSEFIAANGFDESYKEEAQDVDLCLKLRRMRKDIVFANIAGIIHVENGTREKGSENWDDRRYFLWKWRAFLEATILGTKLNREFRG